MLKYFERYACVLMIVLLLILNFKTDTQPVFNETHFNDYVIVLDAGHGGQDGGAIGIETLSREKDINLSITLKVARLLESSGVTVVLTRKDDNALSGDKFIKMEDMAERARIIKLSRPYIVISIHCNSFPGNTTVQGAQSFYYPDSVSGKKLAESIQQSFVDNVDGNNSRSVKEADFFMLRNGDSTNVLVECGFLSSPEEERLLLNENYQDKIAYAIYDGTLSYISQMLSPSNI